MHLNSHFKQYITDISLNDTRIKKIKSAITNWENLFKEDAEIKGKFLRFYTQGSFATNTSIRPQNGNEFDVDTVCIFRHIRTANPEASGQQAGSIRTPCRLI